jgi:GNAT superfamily N-acetyltransferase
MLTAAVEADLPHIVHLANLAYRGGGEAAGWTTEAAYIQGERLTLAQLQADRTAQPHAHLLVYRDAPDQPLLGSVWLEPQADAWYLGLLTVHPQMQNRQLGRAILSAAEAFAKDQGARRIRMSVVNVRDTLIAWYERRGYALTGATAPFPYDEQFGKPLRDDLCFVTLEKAL